MKSIHWIKLFISIVVFTIATIYAKAQNILINEVNQSEQWVELYNPSGTLTVDVSNWILCDDPTYVSINSGSLTVLFGSFVMTPHSYLVLQWNSINSSDGEIALYLPTANFDDITKIKDYFQYGSGHHTRAGIASDAGVWNSPESFVPNALTSTNSLLMLDPTATSPLQTDSHDWSEGASTLGDFNFTCPNLISLNGLILPRDYRATRIFTDGRIEDNAHLEVVFIVEESVELFEQFVIDNNGIFQIKIEDCPDP